MCEPNLDVDYKVWTYSLSTYTQNSYGHRNTAHSVLRMLMIEASILLYTL